MKTKRPKVLCEVLFEPMVSWVVSACEQAGIQKICAVTGYGHEQVEECLKGRCETSYQTEQKGTGHAVLCARDFLCQHLDGHVAVLCGDAPFMDGETLQQALQYHAGAGNAATVITAELQTPGAYGRILREGDQVKGIVEYKDASAQQRSIREVNSGAYWFRVRDLLAVLEQIQPNNVQGEYYLTDTLALLLRRHKRVGAFRALNTQVVLGANDCEALYELNRIAREMVLCRHRANGVELVCSDGVVIAPTVVVGQGTQILPGTILKGKTVVGEDCIIGPNSLIQDSIVEDRCVINASQVYQSVIHSEVRIGPFCQIRPHCEIDYKVKIGDFVEVKNSNIGAGTAISHLTYVGDSDVGQNVNFGCGVVTVNYDGVNKFRTTIKDGAFVGCNTNLVAPVTVGEDAYTAAGSTVTMDVPDGALGIERGRQKNIEGFAARKLKGRKKKV